MIIVNNGTADSATTEAVLFSFDAVTIPFTAGLRMDLITGKTPGVKNPIVLETGPALSPDEGIRFYGTIIPIDGELRMWYMAKGSNDNANGFVGNNEVLINALEFFSSTSEIKKFLSLFLIG